MMKIVQLISKRKTCKCNCQYPLINYLAPKSGSAWGSVIFGLFIFYRETFWFDTALPELVRLISEEQGAALMEVNPRVHYAYCNYQEEGARGGCLLSRAVSCCCCVLMTKSKEKGIIMMENLKEVGFDWTRLKSHICWVELNLDL